MGIAFILSFKCRSNVNAVYVLLQNHSVSSCQVLRGLIILSCECFIPFEMFSELQFVAGT